MTMPAPSTAAERCKRAPGAVMLVALLLIVAAPLAQAQEVPELQITSTNYIAIDAETGEIYAQRGAHERRAEASLTKVFTAIETLAFNSKTLCIASLRLARSLTSTPVSCANGPRSGVPLTKFTHEMS